MCTVPRNSARTWIILTAEAASALSSATSVRAQPVLSRVVFIFGFEPNVADLVRWRRCSIEGECRW